MAMEMGRRLLVGAALGGGVARAAAQTAPPAMVVTLLGTGSPQLTPARFGPSTLVEAGGLRLVFDAGRGCTVRLNQLQVALGSIDAVLLTHLHSDHLIGLPDLWLTGSIQAPYLGRTRALPVLGPPGTARMCAALREAFDADIRIRMEDEGTPEAATGIAGRDFPEAEGVVFDQAGVRVTAFPVDHGPLIHPAVGFRIDYAGRSVVLSGDTRFDERVIRMATGVDLLIHEVCTTPAGMEGFPQAKAVSEHHTSPEEAGRVFARARPRMAAFSHFVEIARMPRFPPVPTDEIARQARLAWDGPLVVGADLMRFTVGETVEMRQMPVTMEFWRG